VSQMESLLESFKEVELRQFVVWVVVSKRIEPRSQCTRWVRVLFADEAAAARCVSILDQYNEYRCVSSLFDNRMFKDIAMFDGTTLHTVSGLKVPHDEYLRCKTEIARIETQFGQQTWGYLDGYARLFGFKPVRPRSTVGCLLCCCLGGWLCGYDCSARSPSAQESPPEWANAHVASAVFSSTR
jgi:hypothetical protein